MKQVSLSAALTVLLLGLAVLPAAAAPAVPAGAPMVLTPVQAAFVQAETRRIEEGFLQKVMSITGASREQVLRAIPAKGRLTDRLARIFSSLERDLKGPLSDEQKALIFAADGEDRKSVV